jgi:hypothetical protein
MFLGSRAPRVRRADNLTAICEPIVYTSGSQLVGRVPLGVRGGPVGNGGKHQEEEIK